MSSSVMMNSATTLAEACLVLSCYLGSSCLKFCGSRFVALALASLLAVASPRSKGPCECLLSQAPQHPLDHREQRVAVLLAFLLDAASYSDLDCETVSLLTRPAKFSIGPREFPFEPAR
jgi:hypothetical protein